ncbi:hypothetical protein SpCBS45565_g00407 [Spizellomyces sp. 'palustris']|nr:hypothetical protein SpCBS45565_g00407 [Spizellomyces sp. 'palustris']
MPRQQLVLISLIWLKGETKYASFSVSAVDFTDWPFNQNPWKECHLKLMQNDGVPLVRRRSGGGAVYHDIGNSNYTIFMPRDEFDRRTNAQLVCRGLHQLDIPALVNDRHDLVIGDKKVSGSAYKLVNSRAYHHGTMLIDADLTALGRYLRPPPKNLVGKGVESVRSNVTRLREHSFTVDHLSFCEAVAGEFYRTHGVQWREPVELTVDHMKTNPKVRDYYEEIRTWEWIYGQTPDFVHRLERSFRWADADILMNVHRGIITEANVTLKSERHIAVASRLSERLQGKSYSEDGIREAFATLKEDLILGTRDLEELEGLQEWLGSSL